MKFKRGYSEVRKKMKSGSKYVVSCNNCKHFSQEEGDDEELCQNNAVTEYDMVVDGNRVYCILWENLRAKGD